MSRTLVSPRSGVLLQVTAPENRKHYCHTLRKEADKERPGSSVMGHEVCDMMGIPSLESIPFLLGLLIGFIDRPGRNLLCPSKERRVVVRF